MATDDYKFRLIGGEDVPFVGYISAEDVTRVSPQALVRGSQNTILFDNGNIGNRPGLKRYDPVDNTQDPVVSSFDWNDTNGNTLLLRVLESGSLQFYRTSDSTWYTIDTFVNTDFSYAKWWDTNSAKEILIMVNGDSNLYAWPGGFADGVGQVNDANSIYFDNSVFISGLSFSLGNIDNDEIVTTTLWSETNTDARQAAVVFQDNPPAGSFLNPTISSTTLVLSETAIIEFVDALTTPISANAAQVLRGVSKEATLANLYALFQDPSSDTATQMGFSNADVNTLINALTSQIVPSLKTADGDTWTELGFINNGTIIVNNVSYAYDLVAGDYLVGIVGIPPEGVFTYSGLTTTTNRPDADFTNDFILVLNNQLIVCSYTSRIVYLSSDLDYTDFTNAGDYVAGDPDFVILDEFPKGGITRGKSAYIGAGVSSWYELTPNVPVEYVQTVGRTVITQVTEFVGSGLTAPLGKNFVTSNGEDILYMDQQNQLRTLGFYRNIATQKSPSLSLPVRQELEEEDFTGGQLRSIGEFTYLVAPLSGKTYLYELKDDVDSVGNITSERRWQPFQTWNISRLAIVEGVVHGYSAETPQLYQLWKTEQWVDDTSETGVYAPYVSIARWGYTQIGGRDDYGSLDKFLFEGYLLPGSDLTANLYNDYQGSTQISQGVLSSAIFTPETFTKDNVNLIGESLIGEEVIGGGFADENYPTPIPKFRAIMDAKIDDCFEFQPEVFSTEGGSRWEILCLGGNPTKEPKSPTYLKIGSVVIST